MANELELRQSLFDSEKELEQLVDLQNRVYQERGLVFIIEYFRNVYLQNPSGRVISFNAFDGDKMVAHYACIPTRMVIDGRIVRGILSLATVTHPDYRGRGLFKTLAKMTYDKAKSDGYEFVIGVANANSFPGFMKYFPFKFVGQLDVRIGYGNNFSHGNGIVFSFYYDSEIMEWRASRSSAYRKNKNCIEGKYGKYVRTIMGVFDKNLILKTHISKAKFSIMPQLYVGIGHEIKSLYFNVPKFIKRPPFNLIFMDLTDGKLPMMTTENVLFQLWDFDVV